MAALIQNFDWRDLALIFGLLCLAVGGVLLVRGVCSQVKAAQEDW